MRSNKIKLLPQTGGFITCDHVCIWHLLSQTAAVNQPLAKSNRLLMHGYTGRAGLTSAINLCHGIGPPIVRRPLLNFSYHNVYNYGSIRV